jgi:acyl carrier protein
MHPVTGERLYCTGDRGRYLPDGNIEFLGREDLQVKVRGYRIELGEIEAALETHPDIKTAIVTTVGEQSDRKTLAAYILPNSDRVPDRDELQTFLSKTLPKYTIPSSFIKLDDLPLSSNGKLDRRMLPKPEINKSVLERSFVAPRDTTEKKLVNIWSEVLKIDKIGIQDNFFFDLRGDSLLATQAVSRIRDTFQIDLSLRHFFETPTIAELAIAIVEKIAEECDRDFIAQTLTQLEQLTEEEIRQQPFLKN